MGEMTFFERLGSLFDIAVKSPFFVTLIGILALTVVVLIINNRFNKKYVKYSAAVIYIAAVVLLGIKYGPSLLDLGDNLVEKVVTLLYFPNIVSYICMIIITILLVLITVINKKLSNFVRFSNIFIFIILVFLFVLTLDVIITKDIDIYSKTAVYTNETLVVLIQSSTGLFFIWLGVLIIDFIANLIVGNKKIESIKKDVVEDGVLFDEPVVTVLDSNPDINMEYTQTGDFKKELSNEAFNKAFNNKKQNEYAKYLSFIDNEKNKY